MCSGLGHISVPEIPATEHHRHSTDGIAAMHTTEADLLLQSTDRLLRRWLALGVLAVLLLPAARGHSQWIGWLPYWLLVAPMLSLVLLHRLRIAAFRRRLLRRPRRAATRSRRQASRPRPSLRQALQVALHGH